VTEKAVILHDLGLIISAKVSTLIKTFIPITITVSRSVIKLWLATEIFVSFAWK
jgi:hypothetical protein